VIKNLHIALQIVERRSYNGGFKVSVAKSCYLLSYSPSFVLSNVPPWIFPDPFVNVQLLEGKKNWSVTDNIHHIVKDQIQREFYNFLTIYTDGSKNPEDEHVGIGICIYVNLILIYTTNIYGLQYSH